MGMEIPFWRKGPPGHGTSTTVVGIAADRLDLTANWRAKAIRGRWDMNNGS